MVETDDVGELKALVLSLLAKIQQLEARVRELETENTELRRQLGLNPTNSHKPPSAQGYAKKPALPKPPGGKVGGQLGHPGKSLGFVDNPDQIQSHHATHCPDCGRALSGQGQLVLRRQVFDLPQPRLTVTEHHLIQHHCPCGCVVRGKFPALVTAPVQYGSRIHALSSLLNIDYRLPLARVSQLWSELTGYTYNESTLHTANQRLFDRLAPIEEQIKTALTAAPVTHHDETGIRVSGHLRWLHVSCSALMTYLFVHPKRGREALESAQSVFKDCLGWTVHDCWSSYFSVGKGRHSLCGAHLMRELQALIEAHSTWAKLMQAFLLDLYRLTRPGPLPPTHHAFWRDAYQTLCEAADQEELPPQHGSRGRPRQSKGRNLLARLVLHQDAVLAFAFESGVPFTNNQAERDLRGAKVKQRVSNCFRTADGAAHYARISGFVSTMRKNKQDILQQLVNVLSGSFQWAT